MNAILLSQVQGLTEIQTAVRDHFQRGGSWITALLVLVGLALLTCLVYALTQRREEAHARIRSADPQRLFANLLGKLDLTPDQRHFLGTVAKALHLPQPAVILLSAALFDRYVEAYSSGRHEAIHLVQAAPGGGESAHAKASDSRPPSDLIAKTRNTLFPAS